MGLGMASVAHRWSVGGVGSHQRESAGGIFVGNQMVAGCWLAYQWVA